MKTLYLCLCLSMMIWAALGCQKTQLSDPMQAETQVEGVNKKLADAMGKDKANIYPELERIARFLAQKRSEVANSLPARVFERDGEEPLSSLPLARNLPKTFTGSDGRTFEVNIAIAKNRRRMT